MQVNENCSNLGQLDTEIGESARQRDTRLTHSYRLYNKVLNRYLTSERFTAIF